MNLARIALASAAVYAIFCAALFILQDRMIYQPRGEMIFSPPAVGLQFEDVRFRTPDGVALHGWFVPTGKPSAGVLLFLHGNAGNISHRLGSIRIFHDLGLNVFIFDYRGYGLSEGTPSEEGLYLDGRAALGVLLDRGFTPEDIVIFGRSLGGAVAARISLETPPAALILESSFTSLPSLASMVFPLFPLRFLLRSGYHTDRILPGVRCPLLVVHSPDDDIIPFSHGMKLFELASEPKTFLQTRGGHNEGFLISGPLYTDGLASFISSVTGR